MSAHLDRVALIEAALEDGQPYWDVVRAVRAEFAYDLRTSAGVVDHALRELSLAGHAQAIEVSEARRVAERLVRSETARLGDLQPKAAR